MNGSAAENSTAIAHHVWQHFFFVFFFFNFVIFNCFCRVLRWFLPLLRPPLLRCLVLLPLKLSQPFDRSQGVYLRIIEATFPRLINIFVLFKSSPRKPFQTRSISGIKARSLSVCFSARPYFTRLGTYVNLRREEAGNTAT